jgi:hypothetical protein
MSSGGRSSCWHHSGWTNFDWVGEIEMRSFKKFALAVSLAASGAIIFVQAAHAASIAGVSISGPAILLMFGLGLIGLALIRRR